MNDEPNPRLERLEANFAHLELQVEQLNEVIIEQGKRVDRLAKEVRRQTQTLATLELERVKANNPKPPHH